MVAVHPWIPALDIGKIKMANGLNLSFFQDFITHITGLSYHMCPKSVFKIKIVDQCTYIPGKKGYR